MGKIITIIIDNDLFMIEIFKFFRIGIAWVNDLSGRASSIILGVWKLETNITLAIRKKLEWHETGQA